MPKSESHAACSPSQRKYSVLGIPCLPVTEVTLDAYDVYALRSLITYCMIIAQICKLTWTVRKVYSHIGLRAREKHMRNDCAKY